MLWCYGLGTRHQIVRKCIFSLIKGDDVSGGGGGGCLGYECDQEPPSLDKGMELGTRNTTSNG